MGSNTNKRRSAKRGVLIALVVFLSIVLVVLLAGTIFMTRFLNSIQKVDPYQETMSQEQIDAILNEETEPTDPDFTGEAISSDEIHLSDTPVDAVETGEEVLNILLVGQDTDDLSQRSRSDSMVLCTINKTTGTLTMTSFMRDMYVKIPNFYDQRMNVAYLVGGFDALYDTLEHNFGVQIDNGVAVNFASFQKVIDAVGGVEIELTAAEADHLNMQNYTWGLFEGVNILTGETALAYSRIRALGGDGGDIGIVSDANHHIRCGSIHLGGHRVIHIAVIQIARDPDGGCAQDQGYVVALAGKTACVLIVIAHIKHLRS
jgi:LCP family protein required for cell wall assembly